ncbi:MAG: hypothetical protein HYZ14_18005 [Bacteroidetes bacterium]|nr:hypothetical protein [Bacteroidota bacterium]
MNKILFHIFLFLQIVTVYGQEEDLYNHRLDENKWDDIRRSIRYENQPEGAGREWTYENQEEYQREKRRYQDGNGQGGNGGGQGQGDGGSYDGGNERPDESDSYSSPPPSSAPSLSVFNGLGVIGYVLLGIFILLVAYLIYKLFVNTQHDGKKVTPVNLEDQAPTEIPLTELQRLLQEALAKGDFRSAVRIYFIFIIRDLAQKNWIRWEKDKTNFQYLREMSGKSEYNEFNRSVSYFEIIWYGKREIDRDTFETIKPDFTRFLDKLGVH